MLKAVSACASCVVVALLSTTASPVMAADGCIQINRLRTTTAVDNKTIVAALKDGSYRKIELTSTCGGLKFYNSFAYDTPEPRLCRGERIEVFRAGSACSIDAITALSADEAKTLLAKN
ncbi:MAG: hypothetical protein SFV21_17245 [Rhodospirillaceae bacterium]|nr:hypothetical protein [Rhodospirillaceae bacterium]